MLAQIQKDLERLDGGSSTYSYVCVVNGPGRLEITCHIRPPNKPLLADGSVSTSMLYKPSATTRTLRTSVSSLNVLNEPSVPIFHKRFPWSILRVYTSEDVLHFQAACRPRSLLSPLGLLGIETRSVLLCLFTNST